MCNEKSTVCTVHSIAHVVPLAMMMVTVTVTVYALLLKQFEFSNEWKRGIFNITDIFLVGECICFALCLFSSIYS